jgi:hypothetical protein
VRCYVRNDLLNWRNAGLMLDVFAPGMRPWSLYTTCATSCCPIGHQDVAGRGLQPIVCAELLIPECRSVPWLVHARSPPEPFCQSQGKKLNDGGAIKPIWANRNLVIENNRESATRIVPPCVKVVPRNP